MLKMIYNEGLSDDMYDGCPVTINTDDESRISSMREALQNDFMIENPAASFAKMFKEIEKSEYGEVPASIRYILGLSDGSDDKSDEVDVFSDEFETKLARQASIANRLAKYWEYDDNICRKENMLTVLARMCYDLIRITDIFSDIKVEDDIYMLSGEGLKTIKKLCGVSEDDFKEL